jgi:hypothetical protein
MVQNIGAANETVRGGIKKYDSKNKKSRLGRLIA